MTNETMVRIFNYTDWKSFKDKGMKMTVSKEGRVADCNTTGHMLVKDILIMVEEKLNEN